MFCLSQWITKTIINPAIAIAIAIAIALTVIVIVIIIIIGRNKRDVAVATTR